MNTRLGVLVLLPAALVLQAPRSAELLRHPDSPEFTRPAPAVSRMTLDTTQGKIRIELQRSWAPHGVDRFYALASHGYYDDAAIFRVRAGTFAQFGINGDPAVAQAWRQQTIPDDPRVLSGVRGTLSFAFAVANGRTTQAYFNLRDNSDTFDREPFVPFARVIDGLAVTDAFYSGYAEQAGGGIRAGHQDPVFAGGNAFLRREFPRLDYIRRVTIE